MMGYNKLPADPISVVLGTVSLVIVIVGCCCGLLSVVSLVLSIVGLVVANKSIKEYDLDPSIYDYKSRNNVQNGKIVCVIGIILSAVFILVWVFYFAFMGEEFTKGFREGFNKSTKNEIIFESENDSTQYDYKDLIESDTTDADTIRIDTLKQK